MQTLENIKQSFYRVKNDIISIKQNLNEWIAYLNRNQSQMRLKIKELEARINYLEEQQKQEKN